MIAVKMRAISKRYLPSGIRANEKVDFEVAQGSIHAIVGENGAGKTTLCKILAGLEYPDSGTIEINEKPVKISSPAHARELGIGMVHQHFLMFDDLSVSENIFFGIEPVPKNSAMKALGIIDPRALEREAHRLSKSYGFSIDPATPVEALSVSSRQQVEILRQLARNISILILDEPTSTLTEQETNALFEKLVEIRRAGHTIILVTHKISEILRIADRVTVMRQGSAIGTYDTNSISENQLSNLIMGTDSRPILHQPRLTFPSDELAFRVENLSTRPKGHGGIGLSKVSFEVRRGEILGICALGGNGLDHLEDALAGFLTPATGVFEFGTARFDMRKPKYHSLLNTDKILYLPSDRMRRGTALSLTVQDNFIAKSRHFFFRNGFFRASLARQATENAIRTFDISASSDQIAAELSGGNIQKLSIARLFSHAHASLMILCEPTRGLDIHATKDIRQRISAASAEGSALLLLSSDIDDILALSDRIMILSRGKSVYLRENDSGISRTLLGEYLLGARSDM